MYSTFIYEDIEVTDKEGLDKAVENEEIDILTDSEGNVSFEEWDGHKLEGYWYNETIKTLKEIAKYIKGFVEFSYEEGYNFRIVFEDGKVYYQRAPEFDWSNIDMEEIYQGWC